MNAPFRVPTRTRTPLIPISQMLADLTYTVRIGARERSRGSRKYSATQAKIPRITGARLNPYCPTRTLVAHAPPKYPANKIAPSTAVCGIAYKIAQANSMTPIVPMIPAAKGRAGWPKENQRIHSLRQPGEDNAFSGAVAQGEGDACDRHGS